MTVSLIPASADLAAVLVDFLEPLVGIVATTVPNDRPSRFVQLSVSTAARDDVVLDRSLVTFHCWGASEIEANELARTVQAIMLNWEGYADQQSIIYRVSCSGPSWFPDPDTDLPRYVVTAEVTHRAMLALTQNGSQPPTVGTTRTDFASYFA